jgi:hypothetical protein
MNNKFKPIKGWDFPTKQEMERHKLCKRIKQYFKKYLQIPIDTIDISETKEATHYILTQHHYVLEKPKLNREVKEE